MSKLKLLDEIIIHMVNKFTIKYDGISSFFKIYNVILVQDGVIRESKC